jgi:hypothetical protein
MASLVINTSLALLVSIPYCKEVAIAFSLEQLASQKGFTLERDLVGRRNR